MATHFSYFFFIQLELSSFIIIFFRNLFLYKAEKAFNDRIEIFEIENRKRLENIENKISL
jgi:hypothetical protein